MSSLAALRPFFTCLLVSVMLARAAVSSEFTIDGISTGMKIKPALQSLKRMWSESRSQRFHSTDSYHDVKLKGISQKGHTFGSLQTGQFRIEAWLVPDLGNRNIGILSFDFPSSRRVTVAANRHSFALGDRYHDVRAAIKSDLMLDKGDILICKDDTGQLLILYFLDECLWEATLISPRNLRRGLGV